MRVRAVRTNADRPDQVLESDTTKHLPKHLLGVDLHLLAATAAILLPKLVVLSTRLGVREDLVRDGDLLELGVSDGEWRGIRSGKTGRGRGGRRDEARSARELTFSSASGSSRFWS